MSRRPNNALYRVGDTRINSMGYVDVKLAEGIWNGLHRENWKKCYGSYPPKGFAITFKDGDKINCDIDNLTLISLKDILKKNDIRNMPQELQDVIRTQCIIKRMIAKRET